MTTTTKLNLIKVLSDLESSQSSGCLAINGDDISWKIYLHQGNIKYGSCSIQLLEQLKYHLHHLECKQAIVALKNLTPSWLNSKDIAPIPNLYNKAISWLINEKHLGFLQASKLIQAISKDDIISCLWLEEGDFSWTDGTLIPIWIPSPIRDSLLLRVSECLDEAKLKRSKWQDCSRELRSIFQRPYFPPKWETKALPKSGSLNREILIELTRILRGSTSIRQLSILLKKDELQVAQILSPYIDQKIICLNHPSKFTGKLPLIPREINNPPKSSAPEDLDLKLKQNDIAQISVKTKKIVCIDDSPTILSEIKRFLDGEQFEITAIDDPVQAVSKVFTIKPDLILLDITMPRINGYKLCGLLRNSGKCDSVPIVMVTGNTGLIDKARAKISGATDYFTKPFSKEDLNQLVAKYLK